MILKPASKRRLGLQGRVVFTLIAFCLAFGVAQWLNFRSNRAEHMRDIQDLETPMILQRFQSIEALRACRNEGVLRIYGGHGPRTPSVYCYSWPGLQTASRLKHRLEPADLERHIRAGDRSWWTETTWGAPRNSAHLIVYNAEGPPEARLLVRPSPEPRRHLRDMLLMGILAAVSFSLLAWVALWGPVQRLKLLATTISHAHDGRVNVHDKVLGTDEIGVVAQAVKDLSTKVAIQINDIFERESKLREYVDATTHDVAIPLTVLQGNLRKLASSNPDAAEVRTALAECQYLGDLIANLATASSLRSGQQTQNTSPVSLSKLVERVALRHQVIAENAKVELNFSLPAGEVSVRGDDLLIERAISNLVHNSIKHASLAAEGSGHVAVLLKSASSGFSLQIENDGPVVQGDVVSRMNRGERIERSDRSRGQGLGLYIVGEVVRMHRFKIEFEAREEGGLLVSLSPLP